MSGLFSREALRTYLGLADSDWGFIQGEATLEVAETLDDLRDRIPGEFYDLIAGLGRHPAVEDLDI